MTLKQLKRKYMAEGAKLGYKKYLNEMAFSPSWNRDEYYSGIENEYKGMIDRNNAKYEKELTALRAKHDDFQKDIEGTHVTRNESSKIAEIIADNLPCEISNMEVSPSIFTPGSGYCSLDVSDKDYPIESIRLEVKNKRVKIRDYYYKKGYIYEPSGRSENNTKWRKIFGIGTSHTEKHKWLGIDDAIAILSEALLQMREIYAGY